MITPKELPTVIAALQHWKDLEKDHPAMKFLPGDDRTGTFFEEHDPLTIEEIDALCKSLEFSQAPSDEQQQKLVLALEACTLHLKQSKEATSATIEKVHNLLTLSVRPK